MALTVCGLVDEAMDAYRWLADRQLPDGSWFNYYQGDARQGPAPRHQRLRLPGGRRLAPPPDHRRRRVPGRAVADDREGHRLHPALAAARRLGAVVARLGRPARGLRAADRLVVDLPLHALRRGRSPSAWPRTVRTGSWRPAGSATPWRTTRAPSRPRSSSPWTGTTRCCRARSRARRAGAASRRAGRPSSWRASACAACRRATGSRRPRRPSACSRSTPSGMDGPALDLFAAGQNLRLPDGSYWTGMVYPEQETFPKDERTTYTFAAMVLAADALSNTTPAAGLFRGEGLPAATRPGRAALRRRHRGLHGVRSDRPARSARG